MFALEKAVRRWRRGLEHRSSLSPRELDELEDHLRVRVDPELELDPGLGFRAWSLSFACAATALRWRDREWALARVRESTAWKQEGRGGARAVRQSGGAGVPGPPPGPHGG